MLVCDNMLDCMSFITAVENLLVPYKHQRLDIFKWSFLVDRKMRPQMMKHIEKETFSVFFQNGKQTFTTLCITKLLEASDSVHKSGYCW